MKMMLNCIWVQVGHPGPGCSGILAIDTDIVCHIRHCVYPPVTRVNTRTGV